MATTDKAEYMREYRASGSDYAERNRNRNKARQRAMTMLADKYRVEFERLFQAQLTSMKNKGMKV